MIKAPEKFTEFDFFMDEDVRARRIGILCVEKRLTPALTQALFRVRENAQSFHAKRIQSDVSKTEEQRAIELGSVSKQIREVKWSSINLMRSFIAQEFIEQYFHYWNKGPLPIMFFNFPFIDDHLSSINNFFEKLGSLNIDALKDLHCSESVFFLDYFSTATGYKFEEKVRDSNNLSRCYRIDSRAHDLMQLTDLLLGITTYIKTGKHTGSRAKLSLVNKFNYFQKSYNNKKTHSLQSVYQL
ncbi:MAG: hypothetical protein WC843_03955 [Candidatus Gracilibacteria bacterium]